ncbi:hypothetical protein BC628DRAFT_1422562 [Trametes gibbosa]|nr:hypothetical protein BC628DRAFT_1422562 [Trametes gibbosa]
MSTSRVWLITGSSTGFGRQTVGKVVSTLRKPATLDDLAPAQIDAAFAPANAAFGRVDIVFDDAGYVAVGKSEAMPDEVRVVRFFREENKPQGGLLLQNSSMFGLGGAPAIAFYNAAKHALEGFSDSLAQELDPAWNIKVAMIEPGAFKTAVMNLGTNMVLVPQHPAYADPALPVRLIRKVGNFRTDIGFRALRQDPKGDVVSVRRVHLRGPPSTVCPDSTVGSNVVGAHAPARGGRTTPKYQKPA